MGFMAARRLVMNTPDVTRFQTSMRCSVKELLARHHLDVSFERGGIHEAYLHAKVDVLNLEI